MREQVRGIMIVPEKFRLLNTALTHDATRIKIYADRARSILLEDVTVTGDKKDAFTWYSDNMYDDQVLFFTTNMRLSDSSWIGESPLTRAVLRRDQVSSSGIIVTPSVSTSRLDASGDFTIYGSEYVRYEGTSIHDSTIFIIEDEITGKVVFDMESRDSLYSMYVPDNTLEDGRVYRISIRYKDLVGRYSNFGSMLYNNNNLLYRLFPKDTYKVFHGTIFKLDASVGEVVIADTMTLNAFINNVNVLSTTLVNNMFTIPTSLYSVGDAVELEIAYGTDIRYITLFIAKPYITTNIDPTFSLENVFENITVNTSLPVNNPSSKMEFSDGYIYDWTPSNELIRYKYNDTTKTISDYESVGSYIIDIVSNYSRLIENPISGDIMIFVAEDLTVNPHIIVVIDSATHILKTVVSIDTAIGGIINGQQPIFLDNKLYIINDYNAESMISKTVYTVDLSTYESEVLGDITFNGVPPAILDRLNYYNKYHKHNILKETTVSDITGWTTGTALPGALGYSQAIVTKSRVYLLGGYNSGALSTVYTAPINTDGTLGAWTTGTSLPGLLCFSQAIVTKSRVYLLGGYSTAYISTVYTAPINTDGTLGVWTTDTNLPIALGHTQAVVTKSRVYLLGGRNGSGYVSTVYTAPINADGTLGAWTTGTSLPGSVSDSQAIVTMNRVHLIGGNNSGTYTSTVYTAPINTDGTLGVWTTGTSLPGVLAYSQAIMTKDRVYLLGGNNGSAYTSTVYTAPINTDGTLGVWTTGTSLPGVLANSQAIVTGSRVYLLGGHTTGYSAIIYNAPFADGWEITSNSYELFLAVNSASGLTPILYKDEIYFINNGGENSNNYTITLNVYQLNLNTFKLNAVGTLDIPILDSLLALVDSTDPFTDGRLTAKYKFDGTGNDLLGAYNLTPIGSIEYATGRFGNAWHGTADGQYFIVPTMPFTSASSGAIAFSINLDSAPDSTTGIFDFRTADNLGNNFNFNDASGTMKDVSGGAITPVLTIGVWYFITASLNRGTNTWTYRTYQDGVGLISTITRVVAHSSATGVATIGSVNGGSATYTPRALIDHIEIYNDELTLEESNRLFVQPVISSGVPAGNNSSVTTVLRNGIPAIIYAESTLVSGSNPIRNIKGIYYIDLDTLKVDITNMVSQVSAKTYDTTVLLTDGTFLFINELECVRFK